VIHYNIARSHTGATVPDVVALGPMRPPTRRLFVWLAVLALVIQNLLPIADAVLHAALAIPSDDHVVVLAASAPHDGSTATTIAKQMPAHIGHACPICEFMTTLGSFTPPLAKRAIPPAAVDRFAVWPLAPPALRRAALTTAQPRAPPAVI